MNRREVYELEYRNKWLEQNEIDREINKLIRPNPMFRDPKIAQENARKGGRPKDETHRVNK